MSMMCAILAVSAPQLAALRARPELASDLAEISAFDVPQKKLEARLRQAPPEVRAQFEAARRAMMADNPVLREEHARLEAARPVLDRLGPFEEVLDLDKSWNILHYLFTGHSDAASAPGDALLSGEPIGRDLGYGPLRAHDVAETRAFRDFLEPLTTERLVGRMDFKQMASLRVYPIDAVPYPANAQAWRTDIARAFQQLRAYVQGAADKGEGLLIWLS